MRESLNSRINTALYHFKEYSCSRVQLQIEMPVRAAMVR